jgi:hypothetical protein
VQEELSSGFCIMGESSELRIVLISEHIVLSLIYDLDHRSIKSIILVRSLANISTALSCERGGE